MTQENQAALLIKAMRRFGLRYDLTQAAGGNLSVKLPGGGMMIKPSGIPMFDAQDPTSLALVDSRILAAGVTSGAFSHRNVGKLELEAESLLSKANLRPNIRPSIETIMHAMLGRFTIHLHPTVVTAVASRADWRAHLSLLFPNALCIDYATPGIDLALEIHDVLDGAGVERTSSMLFLRNHGLVVSGEDPEELSTEVSEIIATLESHLDVDHEAHRYIWQISDAYQKKFGNDPFVLLSNDRTICQAASSIDKNSGLFSKPYCPDVCVYCGPEVLFIESGELGVQLQSYQRRFDTLPKTLVRGDNVYFVGQSRTQTHATEELLRYQLLLNSYADGRCEPLTNESLSRIQHSAGEIYRQKLAGGIS